MNLYKFRFLILLLFYTAKLSSQELNKNYVSKTEYKNYNSFQSHILKFVSKNNFKYKYYNFQEDYEKTDSVIGKWKKVDNRIHFYDIDQPANISKRKINMSKNEIYVEENCVGEYDPRDEKNIYLITLNKKFEILEFIQPDYYDYDFKNQTLKTKYRLRKNPFQIIYIRKYPNIKIEKYNKETNYFDWGINLVDFKSKNYYQIRNCWKFYGDVPKQIINPYLSLKINEDNSLESLKKFRQVDEKLIIRKFKIIDKK